MIPLLAALAMVLQDVLSVGLVQAEARNRAALAGTLDTLAWLAGITTLSISVTTLQGHSTSQKIIVVLAVSAANFIGSYLGVKIGKRYITEKIDETKQTKGVTK